MTNSRLACLYSKHWSPASSEHDLRERDVNSNKPFLTPQLKQHLTVFKNIGFLINSDGSLTETHCDRDAFHYFFSHFNGLVIQFINFKTFLKS